MSLIRFNGRMAESDLCICPSGMKCVAGRNASARLEVKCRYGRNSANLERHPILLNHSLLEALLNCLKVLSEVEHVKLSAVKWLY